MQTCDSQLTYLPFAPPNTYQSPVQIAMALELLAEELRVWPPVDVVCDNDASEIRAFLESELGRINDDQTLLLEIRHDTPAHNTPYPIFEK